jgi:NADP-dependent 3-hydroxy acid dehydrogenase YdfG
MSLEGRTAVITGANGGIGAAVARMLHDRGRNLALASRSGDDLGLERVVARPCDVRDLDALVGLGDATAERFGRTTDVLAGMMTAEDVAEFVVFALERPRHLRMLETALRPMSEASWG